MLLYIHIPFCRSKCGYCAFYSIEDASLVDAYVDALCVDIRETLSFASYSISSIFIGGGTPNTLNIGHYRQIFDTIHRYTKICDDAEISIESNPNLLDKEYILGLVSLGINRLSVGVQSFDRVKLEFLERDHSSYTFQDIAHTLEYAYNHGITNINIDMMIDTPLDSIELLKSELSCVKMLPICHMSVYSLSIDAGSRFASSGIQARRDSLCFEMRDMIGELGWEQYEVSNYAKNKDAECRHNLAYWRAEEYLGVGASAVGRIGQRRSSKISNLARYIAYPDKASVEILSQKDLDIEKIMLGLRTKYGIKKSDVDAKKLEILLKGGKVLIKSEKSVDKIVCEELFLSDEIALWLI